MFAGKILDKLHLKFHCKPKEIQMTDEQTSLCKRFLNQAESLVLDWCACQEDVVFDLLTANDKKNHVARDVHCLSKGSFFGCNKASVDEESGDEDTIIEAVVTFLKTCKNVRKIDFGTNAALCNNQDIQEILKEKSDQKKLENVNMSGIYPTFEVFSIDREIVDQRVEFMKDSLFQTVTEITVKWDDYFEDLIRTLATSTSPVKTLGLLIEQEEFWDYVNPKTPLPQLWKLLKSNKPEIEVKMNLNELPYHKDEDLEDIRKVFNTEMPLTKLCMVFLTEEFAKIVLRNLKKEKHAANLKELGFHYVSSIHYKTVPIKEVFQISKLITDLKCLKGITKISWSGEFVLLTDLLSFVTEHVSTLKEVDIHKHEIVSEKPLAQDEEEEERQKKKKRKKTKYYDPLTDAEILCVEKTVSKILRKPWSMLREIPIQRCPIYNRSYDYHRPQKEAFYVLQNKAV